LTGSNYSVESSEIDQIYFVLSYSPSGAHAVRAGCPAVTPNVSVIGSIYRYESVHILFYSGKDNGYVRAYEALVKNCDEADLEEPRTITSTTFRKFMATVTQVIVSELNLILYYILLICFIFDIAIIIKMQWGQKNQCC
jgi:hypothetical protein